MTGESDAEHSGSWARAAAEWLADRDRCFAAAGAWPAPDVNEAVYLTKARHAADPGVGPRRLLPGDARRPRRVLSASRVRSRPLSRSSTRRGSAGSLGWLALAAGFRHAAVPLVTDGWARVVAAAFFSLALRQHDGGRRVGDRRLRGEGVCLGVRARRPRRARPAAGSPGAFCLCGAATACIRSWAAGRWWPRSLTLARRRSAGRGHRSCGSRWRPCSSRRPAAGRGGCRAGARAVRRCRCRHAGRRDADLRRRAAPHHLLPRTFADGIVARHLLAVAVWWLLHRLAAPTRGRAAADRDFTLAALAISAGRRRDLAPRAVGADGGRTACYVLLVSAGRRGRAVRPRGHRGRRARRRRTCGRARLRCGRA